MSKFRASKIKAIETKYNGYKFRSRLEARYAVFFDALGIKYYYEHEGYSLEGIPYLPDFYLPGHDCFIEIKGVDPTEEELEKCQLLATYTGKAAHIFAGDIWIPQEDGLCWTHSCYPPSIWKHLSTEIIGGDSTQAIHIDPVIIGMLQRARRLDFSIEIDEDDDVTISSTASTIWTIEDLPEYVQLVQQQHRFLTTLHLMLKDHEPDFRQALEVNEGWETEIFEGAEYEGEKWRECSLCGNMVLGFKAYNRHECREQHNAKILGDSPRLLAAYEAARQARF